MNQTEDHASTPSTNEQSSDRVDQFLRIIDEREASLRYVAYGIVGDPHDIEDVLQNAYLQAYRKLRHFVGRSEMQT